MKTTILHPDSEEEVYGVLISSNEMLEEGDVYPGVNGFWKACPLAIVGTPVPDFSFGIIWVRPSQRPCSTH
jgi:hypothetical protein